MNTNVETLKIIQQIMDTLCEAECEVDKENRRVFTLSWSDTEAIRDIQEELFILIAKASSEDA